MRIRFAVRNILRWKDKVSKVTKRLTAGSINKLILITIFYETIWL